MKPPRRNIPEQTSVVSAHQVPFWERKPLKARPSSRGRKCKNAESPFTRSNRISSKPFLMAVLTTRSAFVVRSALGYRRDFRFGGGSAAEGAGADVALRQAQLHGAMRISLSGDPCFSGRDPRPLAQAQKCSCSTRRKRKKGNKSASERCFRL